MPSLPSWLERRLSLSRHFPFFLVQHFKHKRGIVTVPRAARRGAQGGKTPFSASLSLCLRLYKSSGFVRLPGQVWALALRCKVISVMCTQECALSDFPPGFSFSQSCKPRLRLAPGSQTEMSRESISRVPVGFNRSLPGERGPGTTPQRQVQPLFFAH